MLGGRNLELELARFAFSAETSSELEAFRRKHSALMTFQQSELKPSSPKQGTTLAASLVSDWLASGLWIQHLNQPSRYCLTQLSQRAICDFSRKSSSLTRVDVGMRLLLLLSRRKRGQLCREQPLDCSGLLNRELASKPPTAPETSSREPASLDGSPVKGCTF